jgi:2-dehydropantoate 2-reductase
MRFVIFGAGGIGGTIGARLAQGGEDVVLIARGAHQARLASEGLDFRWPGGAERMAIPAVDHPAKVEWRPDDVVFLTMKSQDTATALEALDAAGHRGAVICAQNGVDNERQALRRFAATYGMCVQLPATFLEPGVVVCHSSPVFGVLDLGRYPHGTDEVAVAVAAALDRVGLRSRAEPAIMEQKYAKLLANVGNALAAACGKAARRHPLMKAATDEAKACYTAGGITWTEGSVYRERVKEVRIDPVDGAPHKGSSSWQSLARGTGSIEADFLNGEIVLLGRLHGVATPVNAMLNDLANTMAREGRPPGSYDIEALAARV